MKLRIHSRNPQVMGYTSSKEPDVLNISWMVKDRDMKMGLHRTIIKLSCEDFMPLMLEYEFTLWLVCKMFGWNVSMQFDTFLHRNEEVHSLLFQERWEKFKVKEE